jgi:hypothetical protein
MHCQYSIDTTHAITVVERLANLGPGQLLEQQTGQGGHRGIWD